MVRTTAGNFWNQTLALGLPKALDGYFGGGDVAQTVTTTPSQSAKVQFIERAAPQSMAAGSNIPATSASIIGGVDNKVLLGVGVLAVVVLIGLVR
jgi:hypothetical protein